jgi:hypothetical protein
MNITTEIILAPTASPEPVKCGFAGLTGTHSA